MEWLSATCTEHAFLRRTFVFAPAAHFRRQAPPLVSPWERLLLRALCCGCGGCLSTSAGLYLCTSLLRLLAFDHSCHSPAVPLSSKIQAKFILYCRYQVVIRACRCIGLIGFNTVLELGCLPAFLSSRCHLG